MKIIVKLKNIFLRVGIMDLWQPQFLPKLRRNVVWDVSFDGELGYRDFQNSQKLLPKLGNPHLGSYLCHFQMPVLTSNLV